MEPVSDAFMTPEFGAVVLGTNVVVEALKRAAESLSPAIRESRMYAMGLAVMPLGVGTLLGVAFIPVGAVDPAVLGLVAGSMAASGYQALKPAVKGVKRADPPS